MSLLAKKRITKKDETNTSNKSTKKKKLFYCNINYKLEKEEKKNGLANEKEITKRTLNTSNKYISNMRKFNSFFNFNVKYSQIQPKYNFEINELKPNNLSLLKTRDAHLIKIKGAYKLIVLNDHYLNIFEFKKTFLFKKTIDLYILYKRYHIWVNIPVDQLYISNYNQKTNIIILFLYSKTQLIMCTFDHCLKLINANDDLSQYKNQLISVPKNLSEDKILIYGLGYKIIDVNGENTISSQHNDYISDCESINDNLFVFCERESIKVMQIKPHQVIKNIIHSGQDKRIKKIKNKRKIFYVYFRKFMQSHLEFYDIDTFELIQKFDFNKEYLKIKELNKNKEGDILLCISYSNEQFSIYNFNKNYIIININNNCGKNFGRPFYKEIDSGLIGYMTKNLAFQIVDYNNGIIVYNNCLNKERKMHKIRRLLTTKATKGKSAVSYFLIFASHGCYILGKDKEEITKNK